MLGLAHVGDAVYELLVRSYICKEGHTDVTGMHRLSISMVNANAQAAATEIILPLLDENEATVFKRGKNTKVNSVPHNSSISDYHLATALEALFGWLYLQGMTDRIECLFEAILKGED